MNTGHQKAIIGILIYLVVNAPKCTFSPRLPHIGLFRGQKSTFSWGCMPPDPPTWIVISISCEKTNTSQLTGLRRDRNVSVASKKQVLILGGNNLYICSAFIISNSSNCNSFSLSDHFWSWHAFQSF